MLSSANSVPEDNGNAAWILMSASLVLLMTPALALFYGGMSQQKSVINMMMMSFGALAVVSVVYVLWGYSTSYGSTDIGGVFANPFSHFALHGLLPEKAGEPFPMGDHSYPTIIDVAFQLTFAVITVALVSGSLALGVTSGFMCAFAVGLKYRFRIDDSLDVIGVHLVAGLWGTVAIGFLDTSDGIFYAGAVGVKQLTVQIVIAAAALLFTTVMTLIIGLAIKYTIGWRIPTEHERAGIDVSQHSETAYDLVDTHVPHVTSRATTS